MSLDSINSISALDAQVIPSKPSVKTSAIPDKPLVHDATVHMSDGTMSSLSAIYTKAGEKEIISEINRLNEDKPCPSCDFILPSLQTFLPKQATTGTPQSAMADLTNTGHVSHEPVHLVKLSDEDLRLLKLAKTLLILDKAAQSNNMNISADLESALKTTPIKTQGDISFKGKNDSLAENETTELLGAGESNPSIQSKKQSLNPHKQETYSAVDPAELHRLVNMLEKERQSLHPSAPSPFDYLKQNLTDKKTAQTTIIPSTETISARDQVQIAQDNQDVQEALKRVMLYQSTLGNPAEVNTLNQGALTANSLVSYPMGDVLMLSDSLYKMFTDMGYGYTAAGIDPVMASNAFISYNMENGSFYPTVDGLSVMFDPYKEYRWPSLDYMVHFKNIYDTGKIGAPGTENLSVQAIRQPLKEEASFKSLDSTSETNVSEEQLVALDDKPLEEFIENHITLPVTLKHTDDKKKDLTKLDISYFQDAATVNALVVNNEDLKLNAAQSTFKVKGENGKKQKVDLKEAETLNILAGRTTDNKRGFTGKFENFGNYNMHLDRDDVQVETKSRQDATSFISLKTYGDKGKIKETAGNKGDYINNLIEGYKQEIEIRGDKDKGKGGSDIISVKTSPSARENKIKVIPGNPDFSKTKKGKQAGLSEIVDITVDGNKNKIEVQDEHLDKQLKHNVDINLHFKVSKDKLKIQDKGDKIHIKDPFGNVVEVKKSLVKYLSINQELPENGWVFDSK